MELHDTFTAVDDEVLTCLRAYGVRFKVLRTGVEDDEEGQIDSLRANLTVHALRLAAVFQRPWDCSVRQPHRPCCALPAHRRSTGCGCGNRASSRAASLSSLTLTSRFAASALDKEFSSLVTGFNPTVRWLYKDVTYETIHNPDFRQALEGLLGRQNVAALFSEYDAAPAQLPLLETK